MELNYELLYKLYVIEKHSKRAIARMFNTSHSTITYKLSKYNIAKPTKRKVVNISYTELYDLYVIKHYSFAKIAKMFNCSPSSIKNKLIENGIKIRTSKESKLPKNTSKPTKSQLYEMYEMMTDYEISILLGVSKSTIQKWRKQYNIHNKWLCNEKKPSKDELFMLYKKQHISTHKLAERFDTTPKTICEWLKEYNIPRDNTYVIHRSKAEIEIAEFCSQFTKVITNTRSVIDGEIDIYLPDLKIAIEYNGMYWHSTKNKPKYYHVEKTRKCKEKGIMIYHVWEHEWREDQNKILGIIKDIILGNIIVEYHGEPKLIKYERYHIFDSGICEVKHVNLQTKAT